MMVKRLIALALVGLLLAGGVSAPASAAGYDSLWEKISRQVSSGSGFKGEFSLVTQGESFLAAQGLSFSGLQGEVTYLHDRVDHGVYQLALNFSRESQALGSLLFFSDGVAHALSGSLSAAPVKVPAGLATHWLESDGQDRSWIPALAALATCEDESWLSQLTQMGESYRLQLEMWLAEYAQFSEIVDGEMTISYTLPAEAVKGEIKALFTQLLGDEALLNLLGQLLTQEQALRYLDPQWGEQYLSLLAEMELPGEVVIRRVQSVKGEVASTFISLPVPGPLAALGERLTLRVDASHWEASLEKGEEALTLRWDPQAEAGQASGSLAISYGGFKGAASFTFSSQQRQWTAAEEARDYESRAWTLTLANARPGEADYLAFEPLTLSYEDTLKSGSANLSPTYMETKLTLAYGQGTDTLTLTGKSASPWEMEATAQTLADAQDLSALPAADQASWLARFLAALAAALAAA